MYFFHFESPEWTDDVENHDFRAHPNKRKAFTSQVHVAAFWYPLPYKERTSMYFYIYLLQ